jgi:F-type H+-transporting ATPase subunit delta
VKHSIIAGRYAQALYDEANVQKLVDQTAAELDVIDSLFKQSSDFAIVVNSPALSRDEKLKIIKKICEKARFSRLITGFLHVLTANGRLSAIEDIIAAVKEKIMAVKGEIEVQVSYASEVDDSVQAELKARLAELTGRNVILRESIDPSLLGGMKVLIASRLYDASIKGRLEALRTQLTK